MNCNRCDVEMNLYHPQDGSYFLCPQCNKVDYPIEPNAGKEDKDKDSAPRISKDKLSHTRDTPRTSPNIGNTHLIDIEWEKENNPYIG